MVPRTPEAIAVQLPCPTFGVQCSFNAQQLLPDPASSGPFFKKS
jgi:hypothetical protein